MRSLPGDSDPWRVEYRTTARAEHYAALTFAIVLLREQLMPENTPTNRKQVFMQELDRLEKKRTELEEQFEGHQIGGS